MRVLVCSGAEYAKKKQSSREKLVERGTEFKEAMAFTLARRLINQAVVRLEVWHHLSLFSKKCAYIFSLIILKSQ